MSHEYDKTTKIVQTCLAAQLAVFMMKSPLPWLRIICTNKHQPNLNAGLQVPQKHKNNLHKQMLGVFIKRFTAMQRKEWSNITDLHVMLHFS